MKKRAICVRMVLAVAIVLLAVFVYSNFRIATQHTLKEAKNLEFALRLTATEYYGKDQIIYDPRTPDGLAEGVGEEVARLSGAEGELILGSWDAARRAPRSFIYRKDKVVVIYNYDEELGYCWNLYYRFWNAAMPDWTAQEEATAAQPPVSAAP